MKTIAPLLILLALAQASLGQLSGPLSGTLGPGVFEILEAISVESTDTLRLLPGTTFNFHGPFSFRISGVLLAQGTETDSVTFTKNFTSAFHWRGLRFIESVSSASLLAYCLVEKASSSDSGGGVHCEHSSPHFAHCTISGNSALTGDGGGVHCYFSSSPIFTECTISGNVADFRGGGVFCDYYCWPTFVNCYFVENSAEYGGGVYCSRRSSPVFRNCTISDNTANTSGGGIASHDDSTPWFVNCVITGNSAVGAFGGGVECWYSSPTFTNCLVAGNSAHFFGGGIHCDASSPGFTRCTIRENLAYEGGGVFCWYCSPRFLCCAFENNRASEGGAVLCSSSLANFKNCTITGNMATHLGGGFYCVGSSPTLTNCTFNNNSASVCGGVYCQSSSPVLNSTIIAHSRGIGIYFDYSWRSLIEYCDIFDNIGGNFGFISDDPSQGPPGIGVPAAVNANNDSCDIYFNIFLDPMFVDTAAGDFHLLAGSPCIDAGDPTLPFDPDSTIADIGAFYFDQSAAEPPAIVLPTTYALHPNWPNPFNSSTMIRYDVPTTGRVSLTIYNLLGQRVATLFDGRQLAGSYTISWDAANSPSGVYLCRMDAAGFAQTRKMLLVK